MIPTRTFVSVEGRDVVEVMVDRCAGLDVHKRTVVACVRSPGNRRRKLLVAQLEKLGYTVELTTAA
jgi:hypothetical protein